MLIRKVSCVSQFCFLSNCFHSPLHDNQSSGPVAAEIASEFNCGFDDAKRAVQDADLNGATEILGMFHVNCPGIYRVTLPDRKSIILFPEARVFGAAASFSEA